MYVIFTDFRAQSKHYLYTWIPRATINTTGTQNGNSQNYGALSVMHYIAAPNLWGCQNETLILGTTHKFIMLFGV